VDSVLDKAPSLARAVSDANAAAVVVRTARRRHSAAFCCCWHVAFLAHARSPRTPPPACTPCLQLRRVAKGPSAVERVYEETGAAPAPAARGAGGGPQARGRGATAAMRR
jgi:hypothetical protein